MNRKNLTRDSNIELLRVVAMVMIVTLHYLNGNMGGVLNNVSINETNYYWSHIIESLCIIGPNIFVAISSYFMVNTDNIKARKIIDLYVQMVFWALLFYLLTMVIGANSFSLKEIALVFVPFLGGRRWFVETYILLMLFSPFINILIRKLSRRSYLAFICLWVLVYSIWPSFLSSSPSSDRGYGLANFITIYLIIGYIRMYCDDTIILKNRKHLMLVWGVSSLVVITMSILPAMFVKNEIVTALSNRAWNYDFIFNIIAAISLFLLFKSMKLKSSNIINTISATTFGVFLIHSDFSLWTLLYKDILHCDTFYHSGFFVIHMIFSVIAMFVCSSLLETIRTKLWEISIDRWLGKIHWVRNYKITEIVQ